MRNRVMVRQSKMPHLGLFGYENWWDVWLTPFQCVASLKSHADAVFVANMYARNLAAREQTR